VTVELPLSQAIAMAPDKAVEVQSRPDEELFVFRIGELNFGVSSKFVREVTRSSAVTPVPRAPSFLLGVCGHRGEVFPLVDLLRFLSVGESRLNESSRVFLYHAHAFTIGFLADQLFGLRRILIADKLSPPSSLGNAQEFVQSVVRSSEFGTLVVLNLEKVIEVARQKVISR
jgi:purine-binding chemotaxis protein CheW